MKKGEGQTIISFCDLIHPKCELHKSFIYKKTICKNPSKFCIVKINVSQFWIFEIIRNISKNQQMDSKFPGDWDVRKPNKIVWLRESKPAQSRTLRSVSQFWIFKKKIFWLRAVLACAESRKIWIFPQKRILRKNLFVYLTGGFNLYSVFTVYLRIK